VLAEAAERGEFGNPGDWKAAEERWAERGVTESDLLHWREGYFLSPNIARIGAPAPKVISRRPPGSEPSPSLINMLISVTRGHPVGPKRDTIIGYLLFAARRLNARDKDLVNSVFDILLATRLSDVNQGRLAAFISDLPGEAWEWDKAITLADAFGRGELSTLYDPPVRASDNIAAAFNRDPTRRGLLYFIAGCVRHPRGAWRRRIKDLNLIDAGFEFGPTDGPRIFISVVALRLAAGKWSRDNIPWLVNQLLPEDGSGDGERVMRLQIAGSQDDRELPRELLFALQQRMNVRYPDEGPRLITRLKNSLDQRQSRLSLPEICIPLELPVGTVALGQIDDAFV
jgi:hypothetical protein